jgi:hypothetical protein
MKGSVMTAATTLRNRHPADELADVRAEIKELEAREAKLRGVLIAAGANRIGVQFEAVVWDRHPRQLDAKALAAHFGADALAPFYRKVDRKIVKLRQL